MVTIRPESQQIETISDDISPNFNELLDQETFTQTVYTELKEISGTKELSISPLASIKSTQSGIIYDTVDFWLLNFTYIKVYQSQSHQEDTSGIIQYNLNQTITTTVFASMPVVLATYRNNSVNTNEQTQVITQAVVDDNYQAKMGFSVGFDLDYFFKAQIFGIGPVVGPGNGNLPFDKSWIFDTPMNGEAVLGKVGVSFPVVIPLLNIGVSVGPKIDTDFSASVRSNDSDVDLTCNYLEWEKEGAIQAFSMGVPEFFFEDTTTVDLFDFDMELTLSLVFYLDITIGVPIFNLPFHFPIFSFPAAKTHLQTENVDALNLATNVYPSDDLPFVYGVAYNYTDQNGDNDGILEPGDTVDFSVLVTNLGDGSALMVNSTTDSVNVSVSGEDSIPLLLKNRGNYEIQTDFQFTIPSDYAGGFILVNVTFEYFSVNGSIWTSLYELYFRVVHSGDTYLEVSDIFLDHLGDYWKSGDNIGIYFNVTNRGSANIENAQILVADALDTDTLNPATLDIDQTNISDISIGASTILGFINLSTSLVHDDSLIFLYFYVYYEDATYAYVDLLYFTLPVFLPKPDFNLLSSVGYETDSDGFFEAGETVEIEFNVQNIGEGDAFGVTGFITTDNPDLNLTLPYVIFDDIPASGSTTSTRATIKIPITARNQTATFSLYLTGNDMKEHETYQVFNITIDIVELPSPEIILMSYSIDDSIYGNDDGIPDPGELFLMYINIHVTNVGFSVSGSVNTSSELLIYNDSSFYGYVEDQTVSGDGFIVEVPLNYPGGILRIDVTVFAESLSGRKINQSGYLELTIDTGDVSFPTMDLIDTIPSQLFQNSEVSFSMKVQDPSSTNEVTSGIDKVLVVWTFSNGEIQVTEISDPDQDELYEFEFDTSISGVYQFIPIAIDLAGNIQYLSDNGQIFKIEIISVTTTPTTTTLETSTTTTTPSEAPIPIMFVFMSLLLLSIITRFNRKKSK